MELDLEELREQWDEFFSTTYKKKVNELLTRYPDKRSIVIEFAALEGFSPTLTDSMVKFPDLVLRSAREVLKEKSGELRKDFSPNVRIEGLPDHGLLIQDIKAEDIDQLITFKAIITKRTEIMHKVERAVLRCTLCSSILKFHMTKSTQLPNRCESCKKPTLELDEEMSGFTDMQRAEAQELLERTKGGTPASRIELVIEDDLVNTINPGDNIQITGVMRIKPLVNPKKPGKVTTYSKYIDIIHILNTQKDFEELEITEEEERKILALSQDPNIDKRLITSFAPGIYGHEEVKEAVVLQLFGGTKDKKASGMKMRDDIHLLLIGDPGAAKTRFLQYVDQLAPKCIYVSGKSVTGVGLTASAERDELSEGGWTLKAGALVLASGGVACVDEFDKIDENERAAMHEVMESQTVSIAKAGIVAKFKAKTAMLAAANPKRGRFDPNRPPAEQFDIPPTLLSRFDLIFPIMDVMDEQRDTKLAEHILRNHLLGSDLSGDSIEQTRDEDFIDQDLFKKYVSYARKNIRPVLTTEASERIKNYYVELRKIGKQQGAVPITARQIEGLVRLSEASAKLRLSSVVEEHDAERATKLMDYVLNKILVDRETGRIDMDIITVGKPKSQMEKYDKIMDIIKRLQKQFGEVEIRKIVESASSEQGIEEVQARRFIDDLIMRGELYKVKPGYVKLVEQEYG